MMHGTRAAMRQSRTLKQWLGLNRAAFSSSELSSVNNTAVAEPLPLFAERTYASHKEHAALENKYTDDTLMEMQKTIMEPTTQSEAKRALLAKISEIKDGDHGEIKYVKNKIAKLVQQEMDLLGFKERLSEEEQMALESDVFKEVHTHSNFYFKLDTNKVKKNVAIHDIRAPGNKHRHASVALPHEGVDIQHYLDVENLNEEKMFEIYALYQYLVDLHISQIRPQNLNDKCYIPSHLNRLARKRTVFDSIDNKYFEYFHRWREPTRTWFSQTQEINFQKTLDNRPTTDHYDHDRGTKYEVEWTEQEKFPHVASRLGYPELMEDPLERMLGFERAPAHPGYQFQPFVQTPSMDPDPTLNFEEGDVIYENNKVLEWIRFWKVTSVILFGLSPAFYTFELYQGDGTPSLQWISKNFASWDIPRQFQDGSGWDVESIRYCDDHDYMNLQYSGKRAVARPSHTFFIAGLYGFLSHINADYITKAFYNKDKDLLFVYRPDRMWNETEYVYEMHNLEQMVPHPVTSWKHLSMMRDDGIITVHCMDTKEYLKFYGEDKYWNLEHKDDFMQQTRNLWKGISDDKRAGMSFNIEGRESFLESRYLKVDNELVEAIQKHGETIVPRSHQELWQERIDKKRQEMAL